MVLAGTTLTLVDWYTYVEQVASEAGDHTQLAIGHTIGINPSTVSRWRTVAPNVRDVVAFARAYNKRAADAFMHAYGLTADELGITAAPDPSSLSNRELLDVLSVRLGVEPEPKLAENRPGRLAEQQEKRRRAQRSRTESPDSSQNR